MEELRVSQSASFLIDGRGQRSPSALDGSLAELPRQALMRFPLLCGYSQSPWRVSPSCQTAYIAKSLS